jgi:hypothetical protein
MMETMICRNDLVGLKRPPGVKAPAWYEGVGERQEQISRSALRPKAWKDRSFRAEGLDCPGDWEACEIADR